MFTAVFLVFYLKPFHTETLKTTIYKSVSPPWIHTQNIAQYSQYDQIEADVLLVLLKVVERDGCIFYKGVRSHIKSEDINNEKRNKNSKEINITSFCGLNMKNNH